MGGSRVDDCWVIIVFTGGDDLEYDEKTVEDYLGQNCPKQLQELLDQCEHRRVVFYNKTSDQNKKDEQLQELLSLVNLVIAKNGGKPFKDELFVEQKPNEATKRNDQTDEVNKQETEEKLFMRLTEMIELKFKENISRLEQLVVEERLRLEQQLAEQNAARQSAEKMMKLAEEKFNDEIHKMKENIQSELKFKENISRLEQQLVEDRSRLLQQLAEEKAARKCAEKMIEIAEETSNDKIHKLKENMKTELKLKVNISRLQQQLVEERSRHEQQLSEEKAARQSAEELRQISEEKSKDKIHEIQTRLKLKLNISRPKLQLSKRGQGLSSSLHKRRLQGRVQRNV